MGTSHKPPIVRREPLPRFLAPVRGRVKALPSGPGCATTLCRNDDALLVNRGIVAIWDARGAQLRVRRAWLDRDPAGGLVIDVANQAAGASGVRLHGGHHDCGGSSPTRPSTASRRRSAWPTWRAYSSCRSTSNRRTFGASPDSKPSFAGWSSPPLAMSAVTAARDRSAASRQSR